MSAIAGILLEKGYSVSGSDLKESPITINLEEMGAIIFYTHKKDNVLDDVAEVVISSAIHEDNEELTEAKRRNLKITKRAEKMAQVMEDKKVICVAGAHGKTTTTAMLYCVMSAAGLDPSVIVGGILPNIDSNYRLGKGDYFIAEADESDKSFLLFNPYTSIITNIEDDHMENYGSLENIIDAFEFFMAGNQDKKHMTLCIDNQNVKDLCYKFPEAITYSLADQTADYYITDCYYEGIGICGELMKGIEKIGTIKLQIPGYHNLQNAVGVSALALEKGIDFNDIAKAFSDFYGVNRRFQILYKDKQRVIVDDYAHHPSELKATLKASKEANIGHVKVVFQPHRYSRTNQLLHSFAESFEFADEVLLLPVYSAGETETYGVETKDIYNLMPENTKSKTKIFEDFESVVAHLENNKKQNEMIITMGAGNVYEIAETLSNRVRGKK